MKANLAKTEPNLLKKWEDQDLYSLIRKSRKGRPKFVLHDGPPYANGHIHAGTALNKIIKDIIVKAKNMEGYDSPYIPGWDCHGLPIEHMVDKELGKKKKDISKSEFRKQCREYAKKFIGIQMEEFKRLGVIGNWENPYLTMNFPFEAATIRELGKFMANDGIYKGNKPIHWCTSCRTALAEAEVEYEDHASPSVWVKFPLTDESAKKLGIESGPKPSVVIWTTTPWTLPANLAVCLHPDFSYALVQTNTDRLILAKDLVDVTLNSLDIKNSNIEWEKKGSELRGLACRHPFLNQESTIIVGEHVTLDQGTGCVHTAPGHGQEDYEIGLKYDLPVYNPVDSRGVFIEGTPHFAGLYVWKANPVINQKLEEDGFLLKEEEIAHSYPHCWRCKNPIIFRATPQWFISMKANDLREKALHAISQVNWIPNWGQARISGMVDNRPDWCISRQRAWGVPITVFYCTGCEQPLYSQEITERIAKFMDQEGADVWFEKEAKEFLPDGTKCTGCGGTNFKKENDILDVWFDSGVSHAIVCEGNDDLTWPVDLYVEGSDQHRGWFQSTLLESVATRGEAAYKQVLTHGYVVDGAGKKMSKSLGNVIKPQTVIDRFGAEMLRLWVASENYREDIRLSDEILKRLSEAYRKIRNTFRFMLGNLYDFDPSTSAVPYDQMLEIDRLMLHRLEKLIERIRGSFERHEFHVFFHSFNNYCTVDLSAFYLDVLKDRLYTFRPDSVERRSAQTVLYQTTLAMVRLMAPVLSFTAEELWAYIPGKDNRPESIHLDLFPELNPNHLDSELGEKWERIMEVRQEASKVIELARKNKLIGSSLDARVYLYLPEPYRALFEGLKDANSILIVSELLLESKVKDPSEWHTSEEIEGLKIRIHRASGEKCERCWNYEESVGTVEGHETICSRCVSNLEAPV